MGTTYCVTHCGNKPFLDDILVFVNFDSRAVKHK